MQGLLTWLRGIDWAGLRVKAWNNSAVRVALVAIAVLAIIVALSGCAGDPVINAKVVDAQIAAAAKPTFEMTCPPEGCKIGGMAYTDPRDRGQIRAPTNGYDVANTLIGKTGDVIGGAVLPIVAGKVVVEGFKAVRDAKGAQTTTTSTTTTTTTNTADGGSVAGSGTASTDSHAVDSHAVDDHSATATPTIVTQPAPVIVPVVQP